MESQKNFQLAFVATFAGLILAGCSSGVRRDCVNERGVKLPDSECDRYVGRSGAYIGPRYIYGGSEQGGRILGGSTTKPANYSPPGSRSSRGGFGGFGSGFS